MRKKIFTLLAIAPVLFFKAQEHESAIDEIVVEGKLLNTSYAKVIENVDVITKSEIQSSPSKSIDELLQNITGVDVRRRGSNGVQSDISVRGGSFEQVLILLNGIRMNDAQTGHNSMNIPVDLANVERIEVIKGPAARRFGNGAFAVINIITKTSPDENVTVSAEGGDFKTYSLGLAATFGNEKSSSLFQINRGASDGYRYNTDYDLVNVFYQNQIKFSNGNLDIQGGFSEKKFGANGFYASKSATEQYEELQSSVAALKYSRKFGNFNLNSSVYWRRGQDMYLYNRAKPEIYRNMHIGNNVGAEISGSYKSSLGTTALGFELRKEILASSNLGHRNRFLSQMFLEHHFSFVNEKLQIVPGVTWANYSDSGNYFYPGVDVGFDFNENHKIYGNVAKMHRIPTFTDFYYVSRTEVGNSGLKPENALYSELGYRFLNKNFQIKVSGFIKNSENTIDWIKPAGTSVWNAMNVGEVHTKGVEAEMKQRIFSYLNYSVGYTFIDGKYANSTGLASKYVLDHFKHQITASTEIKFLKYFSNELSYRYSERANRYSYHLLDEKLSFRKNNFDIYFLINNLTNATYTEAFDVPMPGRWFHLGLKYSLSFN